MIDLLCRLGIRLGSGRGAGGNWGEEEAVL